MAYGSNRYEDAIKFFEYFESSGDLINWMRERTKAEPNIYIVNGSKDVVVVVPTANYNSALAVYCRNNLFNGLQIIFVESNGKYFNYSHSVNKGIEVALTFNPKWVIISNDDMQMIDPPSVLLKELNHFSTKKFNYLYAKGPGLHSKLLKIGPHTKMAQALKLTKNNKHKS